MAGKQTGGDRGSDFFRRSKHAKPMCPTIERFPSSESDALWYCESIP